MNEGDLEIDMGANKHSFVLFKEKIRVFEGEWFSAEKIDWSIPQNGNGEILRKVYSINRKSHYTASTDFSVNLPGILNIGKQDFEVLLQSNDYFGNLAQKILARETTPINLRSSLVLINWLAESMFDAQYKKTDVLYVDTEGFFEIKSGRRKTYLPAGIATRTILSLGNRFLSLSEARKLVKEHTQEQNALERF